MKSLAGKTILQIEDAEDFKLITRKTLEGAEARYLGASDIQEGLFVASTQKPHLILLDLHMPGMNGFDFLRKREQDSELAKIPVIVISGEKVSDLVLKAIQMGANDYLIKPFDKTNLLKKVRKILYEQNLLKLVFPLSKRPRVDVYIPAQVVAVSVASLQIKAPIQLVAQATVAIDSKLLRDLKCQTYQLQTLDKGQFLGQGIFLNEVKFVGIRQEDVNGLKKRIKNVNL